MTWRHMDHTDCVYNVSAWLTVNTDKFTLFVYCSFLALLSTTVCSQNINKQNVNIADETLTDYSFLSRYHYTKSKNCLKRRYRIRHWIPMFIGALCSLIIFVYYIYLEIFGNERVVVLSYFYIFGRINVFIIS